MFSFKLPFLDQFEVLFNFPLIITGRSRELLTHFKLPATILFLVVMDTGYGGQIEVVWDNVMELSIPHVFKVRVATVTANKLSVGSMATPELEPAVSLAAIINRPYSGDVPLMRAMEVQQVVMIIGPLGPVTTVASGWIVGALERPTTIFFAVAMDTANLTDTLVYVTALKCELPVPLCVSRPDRGTAVGFVSTTPTPKTADRHNRCC